MLSLLRLASKLHCKAIHSMVQSPAILSSNRSDFRLTEYTDVAFRFSLRKFILLNSIVIKSQATFFPLAVHSNCAELLLQRIRLGFAIVSRGASYRRISPFRRG